MRLAAALALTLLAAPAFGAFEDLGAGARAPGMGDAFTAVADDVYAIHYNPAGLAQLSRPELGTSYSRLLYGLSDNSDLGLTFIGYAHPLSGGKDGVLGGAWQQYAFNGGLYQEHTFTASYARLLRDQLWQGRLYGGVSAKYLYRSFGTFSEASNATSGLGTTGSPDPVLSGRASLGKPDADLGLLYKLQEHYSVGLAVSHLWQPNVSFARNDADRLPMRVKLGLNYGSLLSNLGLEYQNQKSPVGTQDHTMTLALERWFPRLFVGDFGVRGALSEGTRSFRQLSAGLSYRTARFNVDYGFSIPINSVVGTAGTHRLAVSVRFGSPKEPDESVLMILEAMRQLKKGAAPELRVAGLGLTQEQKALLEEHVALAKSLEAQAKYRAALDELSRAIAVSPGDTELLKAFGRLNWVAQQVSGLSGYKADPVEAAWHEGILAYMDFNDAAAIEKVSAALSLSPDYKALDAFLSQLELATGIKRPEIAKTAPKRFGVEARLAKAAVAVEEGRYDEAIALSLEVLAEEPGNVVAWENLGTSYFAIGDYPNSLTAWDKAYSLEKNPARRAALAGYIKSVRNLLAKPKEKPKPTAEKMAELERLSPQEIQRLYNAGVDDYTAGRLQQAKEAFQRVLSADPAYVPAAKALRRVIEEQSQK